MKLHFSISGFPEIRRMPGKQRKELVIQLTKELSLGVKYAVLTGVSIQVGILVAGIVANNTDIGGDAIGNFAYGAFL